MLLKYWSGGTNILFVGAWKSLLHYWASYLAKCSVENLKASWMTMLMTQSGQSSTTAAAFHFSFNILFLTSFSNWSFTQIWIRNNRTNINFIVDDIFLDQLVSNLSSVQMQISPGQSALQMDHYSRKVFVGGLPPDIDEGEYWIVAIDLSYRKVFITKHNFRLIIIVSGSIFLVVNSWMAAT